jgi:hypothetical protein
MMFGNNCQISELPNIIIIINSRLVNEIMMIFLYDIAAIPQSLVMIEIVRGYIRLHKPSYVMKISDGHVRFCSQFRHHKHLNMFHQHQR